MEIITPGLAVNIKCKHDVWYPQQAWDILVSFLCSLHTKWRVIFATRKHPECRFVWRYVKYLWLPNTSTYMMIQGWKPCVFHHNTSQISYPDKIRNHIRLRTKSRKRFSRLLKRFSWMARSCFHLFIFLKEGSPDSGPCKEWGGNRGVSSTTLWCSDQLRWPATRWMARS